MNSYQYLILTKKINSPPSLTLELQKVDYTYFYEFSTKIKSIECFSAL